MNYSPQQFRAEYQIVQQLRLDRGVTVDMGDTTPEIRRDRIRKVIVDCNLANHRLSPTKTYRQAFEQVFGESLFPKAERKRA